MISSNKIDVESMIYRIADLEELPNILSDAKIKGAWKVYNQTVINVIKSKTDNFVLAWHSLDIYMTAVQEPLKL